MSRWIRAPGAVIFLVLAAAAAAVEPASAASSVEFRTAAAEPADAITVDGLPGSVELPLDGTLVVASPYAGRVASILVDEGDRVTAGEVLATVVSRDWADERARLVRLEAELGVARQQAARDATLAAEGVVASSRAAASAAARRGLEAELAALRAVAGRWTPAPGEAAGFALTAPVFERMDNFDLLERELALDISHGLVGKTAIHPSQIETIHAALRVNVADLNSARLILQQDAAAVFKHGGAMCEPATHRAWAQNIVARAEWHGVRAEPPSIADGESTLREARFG